MKIGTRKLSRDELRRIACSVLTIRHRNRHDIKRWIDQLRPFATIAHDLVCEGRRGEAIGVLLERMPLADAIEVTAPPHSPPFDRSFIKSYRQVIKYANFGAPPMRMQYATRHDPRYRHAPLMYAADDARICLELERATAQTIATRTGRDAMEIGTLYHQYLEQIRGLAK